MNQQQQKAYELGRKARKTGKDTMTIEKTTPLDIIRSYELGWHHEGVDMAFRLYGRTVKPSERFTGPINGDLDSFDIVKHFQTVEKEIAHAGAG